ncbi:MAG: hypothetical protein RL672_357 [Actinomycetota bacterium]|jgi:uncharacterized protein (TIGR01777 family)
MRILISGASGLIGSALATELSAQGHKVSRLVRRAARDANEIEWHPGSLPLPAGVIDQFDVVVNLAGATTGKLPWTSKYKRELIESRLDSTSTLVDAMRSANTRPKVFLSGSASGFYGDTGDRDCVESDDRGTGFLSDLAVAWEAEAFKAPSEVRVVTLRTTMVLSRRLGALGRLLPILRAGLGGPLGSGKQWWAWISLTDEVRAIIHLMNNADARGAYNLTAPQSTTCRELVDALGRAFKRPTLFAVPAFVLRLVFGLGADELLLCNQRMSANRLLESGFRFTHPTIDQAAAWVAGRE